MAAGLEDARVREWLFGRQAVRESLYAGRRQAFRLLVAEGVAKAPILDEITAAAQKRRVVIEKCPRQDIARFTGVDDHQGVALETSGYPFATPDDMLALAHQRREPLLLLLLDLLQDVHNVGSLLRTAEVAGVHGIMIQERRAAGITPVTVNTSSGAVEHLLVAQVANLAQAIEQLKAADVWIAGLEDARGALPYTQVNMTLPLAIVVGSEGEGLRRLVRERCDWLMSIPMRGKITSLNAAVAGSIALYEALRQRSQFAATTPSPFAPGSGAV
ncbi:MAG TPA: 23S rRNA (guanosine(2251)-2'-O)-methyltransferase RlmB [Anaerolineae bacterium]|nr:23S rRNA (guanosine(2251)-2'-O)-methyltransferase RlmB [Anaerolineae bacterium]HQI87057.1 23S rRNA (guanosine(2251)-2'-O)-methyltransferase RlmB [Anaerolineae bacterium]